VAAYQEKIQTEASQKQATITKKNEQTAVVSQTDERVELSIDQLLVAATVADKKHSESIYLADSMKHLNRVLMS